MSTESLSQGWRNKGNYSYGNYQQSNDDGRRKTYLELALASYYRAYETANDMEEKSSAAKNYGMAAWRLAAVLVALKEKPVQVEFRFREAIRYFSKVCWFILLFKIVSYIVYQLSRFHFLRNSSQRHNCIYIYATYRLTDSLHAACYGTSNSNSTETAVFAVHKVIACAIDS